MTVSNVAGVALTTSSLFLLVVAVALNSPHLFYMSTAIIVTIVAARVQAWYAVRGLRVTRRAPAQVNLGEWATVEIDVETDQKWRRPLVSVWDHLPPRLINDSITPSTPIAPASGQRVQTQYRFKPHRRGRFRWSKVSIVGTDALGLVTLVKEYSAEPVDLLVLPQPIQVSFDALNAAGWGAAETEQGRARGTGIEPRGIREYVHGDSMRYVHWRLTAKTGQLVVKDFETGSHAALAFFIQNSIGSEIGEGSRTTLELMCGHLAHICGRVLRQGIRVQFPSVEDNEGALSPLEREHEVLRYLAMLNADQPKSMAEEILSSMRNIVPGATVHICIAVADPKMPEAIDALRRSGHAIVALVYDAAAFDNSRRLNPVDSAANPRFLDMLRGAGAMVREMPLDGLGK